MSHAARWLSAVILTATGGRYVLRLVNHRARRRLDEQGPDRVEQ